MDIIKIPFGYLLDWLCQLVGGSYGIALILFSLLIKLVLMPMSAKSKKSMLKMSRLGPQLKALEIECEGDDYLLPSGTGAITNATVIPQKCSFINGRLRIAQTGEVVHYLLTAVALTPVTAGAVRCRFEKV